MSSCFSTAPGSSRPSSIAVVSLWLTALSLVLLGGSSLPAEEGLIGHWSLTTDGNDASGNGLHATAHDVVFPAVVAADERTGAAFNGRSAWLEVPNHDLLQLGTGDFSLAAWVSTESALDDVPGDIASRYDAEARRGFHLGIKTNAGVTSTQANWRQLQFGIDQNRASEWVDCGIPGEALLAFALCTYEGQLYAGTCEPGPGQAGHVYRYGGDGQWVDCGSPDRSNSVTALAVFDGELYAGTGKYRVAGSALPESENTTLGGHIYRYDGESKWIDCGGLPGVEAVGGMAVFKGRLYASSLYRPAGFFRYEGDHSWQDVGVPPRPEDSQQDLTHMRVESVGVHDGWLYASSYDGGYVFRFDGEKWENCGLVGDNTQTYSFAVYDGRLYVGTWPSGRVYLMEEPHKWTDVGQLGMEQEVMGMLVHNGRFIAGTLPLAEVYQYDGGQSWEKLARLDHTPDVKYRRAWTMAEFDGQVFCSTLPNGKVHSWRAGRVAMADRECPSGWHHVAAVRSGEQLTIYLDGEAVGTQTGADLAEYDLSNGQPLLIGRGPNDFFNGQLSDVRLYNRALSGEELQKLAEK